MNRRGVNIGLRQARRLCQMAHDERLAFLAEGLPIILSSAQNLWRGSRKLGKEMPREAGVLKGFAEEEAAKALIFMDAVRCPSCLIGSKMGKIVGWSYDHLARLIYAEAGLWRPVNMAQLREYVDSSRKAHVLEGYVGEYIVPNWSLYEREQRLYADIEVGESGALSWSDPIDTYSSIMDLWEEFQGPLRLTEAMSMLGIFTPGGLKATSEIWDQVEFADQERPADARRLMRELVNRLTQEELPSEKATEQHVNSLFTFWQLPMYNLDFKMIPVSMEELEAEREEQLGWII